MKKALKFKISHTLTDNEEGRIGRQFLLYLRDEVDTSAHNEDFANSFYRTDAQSHVSMEEGA